jgi:hypothetical protein
MRRWLTLSVIKPRQPSRIATPAWTDVADTDPGVEVLQLFDFLGENLRFRANRARGSYFSGGRLTASDVAEDQSYRVEKKGDRERTRHRSPRVFCAGVVTGWTAATIVCCWLRTRRARSHAKLTS